MFAWNVYGDCIKKYCISCNSFVFCLSIKIQHDFNLISYMWVPWICLTSACLFTHMVHFILFYVCCVCVSAMAQPFIFTRYQATSNNSYYYSIPCNDQWIVLHFNHLDNILRLFIEENTSVALNEANYKRNSSTLRTTSISSFDFFYICVSFDLNQMTMENKYFVNY